MRRRNFANPLVAALALSCCAQQPQVVRSDEFVMPPTLCQATRDAQALVQCQFTAVGQTESASQAGVIAVPGFPIGGDFDAGSPPPPLMQFTIDASSPIVGSLTGVVNGFAIPANVNELAGPVGEPRYADGTWASGYCFLAKDNGRWVLELDGFFQQNEQDAGILQNDNMYRQGIAVDDFLSAVQSALAAPCPPQVPNHCKQGYEGCQLICDPADAGSCPVGQQCQPCPTGGSICYKTCGSADAGSCPTGEYCSVSNQGGYVCAVPMPAPDGG